MKIEIRRRINKLWLDTYEPQKTGKKEQLKELQKALIVAKQDGDEFVYFEVELSNPHKDDNFYKNSIYVTENHERVVYKRAITDFKLG